MPPAAAWAAGGARRPGQTVARGRRRREGGPPCWPADQPTFFAARPAFPKTFLPRALPFAARTAFPKTFLPHARVTPRNHPNRPSFCPSSRSIPLPPPLPTPCPHVVQHGTALNSKSARLYSTHISASLVVLSSLLPSAFSCPPDLAPLAPSCRTNSACRRRSRPGCPSHPTLKSSCALLERTLTVFNSHLWLVFMACSPCVLFAALFRSRMSTQGRRQQESEWVALWSRRWARWRRRCEPLSALHFPQLASCLVLH